MVGHLHLSEIDKGYDSIEKYLKKKGEIKLKCYFIPFSLFISISIVK